MLVNQEKATSHGKRQNIKSMRMDIDVKTVKQSIKMAIFLMTIFRCLKIQEETGKEI